MKKLLLVLAFSLFAQSAWAQNPTCPTRPFGDNSNACASTAFVVQNASIICLPVGSFPVGTGAVQQCSTVAGSTATLNGGPLTITPTSGTANQGFFVNQSGSTVATALGANLYYNYISIFNDQAVGNTVSAFYTYGLEVDFIFGSNQPKGSKYAIRGITNGFGSGGATSTGGDIIGISGQAVHAAPNGGSAGVYVGTLYGAELIARAFSGAVNYLVVSSAEVTGQIDSGGSSKHRWGMSFVSNGATHGGFLVDGTTPIAGGSDAAIQISAAAGTVSWISGIILSNANGLKPIDTTGCIICTDGSANTITTGIDLSAYTITGNFLNSSSFSVTGGGTVVAAQSIRGSSFGAGTAPTATAFVSIAASTVGVANINFAPGVNTTPNNNGDFWFDSSVLRLRAGAATLILATTAGANIPAIAQGDLLYGSAANVLSALTKGTATQLLHSGNTPTWSAVVSADMNITTTTCTNQFVTAISSGGVGTCTTATLASAQFANQGTTTTVLHGNAAGNPSFAAIANADLTNSSVTYGTTTVALGSSSLTLAGLTSVQANIIGPTQADSTTAFKITKQNLSTAVVTVDTSNSRVGINKTPGAFDLDVNGTASIGTNLQTVNGSIQSLATGIAAAGGAAAGDVVAARTSTQGLYGFGNASTKYLYYDATNFNFVGGPLTVISTANVATTSAVCINTTSGLLTYDGTLGTCTVSDERLKNMGPRIIGALSKLLKINGVYYTWKDPSLGYGRQIGIGAQTVEKVFPELVHEDSEGKKSADYLRLTAPIIEALREIDGRIGALEKRKVR